MKLNIHRKKNNFKRLTFKRPKREKIIKFEFIEKPKKITRNESFAKKIFNKQELNIITAIFIVILVVVGFGVGFGLQKKSSLHLDLYQDIKYSIEKPTNPAAKEPQSNYYSLEITYRTTTFNIKNRYEGIMLFGTLLSTNSNAYISDNTNKNIFSVDGGVSIIKSKNDPIKLSRKKNHIDKNLQYFDVLFGTLLSYDGTDGNISIEKIKMDAWFSINFEEVSNLKCYLSFKLDLILSDNQSNPNGNTPQVNTDFSNFLFNNEKKFTNPISSPNNIVNKNSIDLNIDR